LVRRLGSGLSPHFRANSAFASILLCLLSCPLSAIAEIITYDGDPSAGHFPASDANNRHNLRTIGGALPSSNGLRPSRAGPPETCPSLILRRDVKAGPSNCSELPVGVIIFDKIALKGGEGTGFGPTHAGRSGRKLWRQTPPLTRTPFLSY
jgi:hypothetical protein